MADKIQLTINDPCHENWDKMTPSDKGRFCDSCQKQVVDFTNMSDRDIAQFFKKPSTGSLCGRFMKDQLDRDLEIPRKRIPWVKYFFQIAIPSFLASAKVYSQGAPVLTVKQKVKQEAPVNSTKGDMAKKPAKNEIEVVTILGGIKREPILLGDTIAAVLPTKDAETPITGRVTDERGNPVYYATIQIKGTNQAGVTDGDGNFHIRADHTNWATLTLICSSPGFETVERTIVSKEVTVPVNIGLVQLNPMILGEIVCIPEKKGKAAKEKKQENDQSSSQQVQSLSATRKDDIEAMPSPIIIYPNPAKATTGITIEWKSPEEGYHRLQLMSVTGVVVFAKEIWIDAAARVLHLDLPAVAPGNYILQVMNKKSGKKFAEKIAIQ